MNPWIHLVVHYYIDPLPARQAEYDYCLLRNLNNPSIQKVHNLADPQTPPPPQIRDHPKYVESPLPGQWVSYKDLLRYINRELAGEVVCIANLDIFLDDTKADWGQAANWVKAGVVLCLTRLEFKMDGTVYLDPVMLRWGSSSSQDAWIFHAPLEVPDCDFELGTLGCDNAIAERFLRTGRMPVNAAGRFPIFHFDEARGKTMETQKAFHAQERGGQGSKFPEESGQYLVPDIDRVTSVDHLLESFKATELQRYTVVCQVLNLFLALRNR
jgi:hypothetical protein